jgi:hypothetical protein
MFKKTELTKNIGDYIKSIRIILIILAVFINRKHNESLEKNEYLLVFSSNLTQKTRKQ